HRAIANVPNLLRAYMSLSNELRFGTRLDPRLRELAIVTVGWITNIEHEFTAHSKMALAVGVRQEQLDGLGAYDSSPSFNAHERAVIRFALASTQDVSVSDEIYDQLRQLFDDALIVELVMEVSFYNLVVRVLGALGL
ncbi:MAG: carboxymuconolactone decarboxylase family protein, partial [Thiobacillaceae bacterium]